MVPTFIFISISIRSRLPRIIPTIQALMQDYWLDLEKEKEFTSLAIFIYRFLAFDCQAVDFSF